MYKIDKKVGFYMEFEIGTVTDGVVNGIKNFGAFVDLEGGKSGLVHISEVSDQFVKNIDEYLKEGQNVKVKVISIDERGKLGLSIKQAKQSTTDDSDSISKKISRENNFKKFVNSKSNSSRFEDMMAKFKQISDEKISNFTEKTKWRGSNKKSGHKNDFKF